MNKNIISLKSNKVIKRCLLVTIVLTSFVTLTGFFEILFSQYQATFTLYLDSIHFSIPLKFYLDSGILMAGIGFGIMSIFAKKRNFFFYTSIMIILVGFGILATIMGYTHPDSVGSGMQVNSLGSFFVEYLSLILHNVFVALIVLLSGPTIIIPYMVLSTDILMVISLFASFTAFYGYKGVILFLGMFHIYPEFYAIFLACLAGIRVALNSFKSLLTINKGFKSLLLKIKDLIVNEIRNTMPKVIVLLVIAALLETLWTPFWINYWLNHIL